MRGPRGATLPLRVFQIASAIAKTASIDISQVFLKSDNDVLKQPIPALAVLVLFIFLVMHTSQFLLLKFKAACPIHHGQTILLSPAFKKVKIWNEAEGMKLLWCAHLSPAPHLMSTEEPAGTASPTRLWLAAWRPEVSFTAAHGPSEDVHEQHGTHGVTFLPVSSLLRSKQTHNSKLSLLCL